MDENAASREPVNLTEELYSFAVAHAKSSAYQPADADDYLQEILIVFLEISRRYNLPRVQLIKVAKTAARNRIRDLIRHRKVRIKYHVHLDEMSDSFSIDESSLHIARDLIGAIAKHVSETGRNVMRLVHDGLDRREIARLLDIPSGAVDGFIEEARIAYKLHAEDN